MSSKNQRRTNRVMRHVCLGLACCLWIAGFSAFLDSARPAYQMSMATAYGSFILFMLTLFFGPWHVFRSEANPSSSYLRRDVGIWAGILALVHVVAGLQVHMEGKIWQYFLPPPEWNSVSPIRADAFGLTNYAGLGAAMIFILLLCMSNDASIRRLGGKRWKFWQRSSYVAAILMFVHGWVYQALEKRSVFFVLIFTFGVLLIVFVQFSGFRRFRKSK